MPLVLIIFIVIGVGALAVVAYILLVTHLQHAIVSRAQPDTARPVSGIPIPSASPVRATLQNVVQWLTTTGPQLWNVKTEEELLQAGYDQDMAPMVYGAVRIVLLALCPFVALALVPKFSFDSVLFYMIGLVIIAIIIPKLWLIRAVRLRQSRIRHSLPDALDLIVVCIDAGISLDAAILRVAKELGVAHPELAEELLVVNRKTHAGVPRADALRGLWMRTGVVEVRALVSHVVQSEKWGTSSGKVLRVYATTLRRQRRQAAEKKAATAPVKMLVPLGIFIFPALLLVILGPVMLNIMTLFKT